MGEQFIKVIMDNAINQSADLCYVTIFPKHQNLIIDILIHKFTSHFVNNFNKFLIAASGFDNIIGKAIYDDTRNIQGFLHLKNESGIINDIRPKINAPKILKILINS